jgi:hypothetical protein
MAAAVQCNGWRRSGRRVQQLQSLRHLSHLPRKCFDEPLHALVVLQKMLVNERLLLLAIAIAFGRVPDRAWP